MECGHVLHWATSIAGTVAVVTCCCSSAVHLRLHVLAAALASPLAVILVKQSGSGQRMNEGGCVCAVIGMETPNLSVGVDQVAG